MSEEEEMNPATSPPPIEVRWTHDPVSELIRVLVKAGNKKVMIELLEESLYLCGPTSVVPAVFIRGNIEEGGVKQETIFEQEKILQELWDDMYDEQGELRDSAWLEDRIAHALGKR